MIELPGGDYRAFVLLDNDTLHAVDIDAGAVAATLDLTTGLSELPDEYMRLDGAGRRLTVDDDGNGTITVYAEDLYAGSSQVFGQVSLPFADRVVYPEDVAVDKQGNVFVSTVNGVYWFDPTGAARGYILAGDTFYSDNQLGSFLR